MEALRGPLVETLLWAVAGLATFWIVVPSLVFLVRRGRVDLQVEVVDEDPARAKPEANNRAYEAKFRALVALGFRPVGLTSEKATFLSPLHWSWRSHGMRWLVSPDRTIYFGLFRVAGGGPWRSCAVTLFERDGFLETACSKAGTKVPDGDQRRMEIEEVEPAELVARHQAFAAEAARDRASPVRPRAPRHPRSSIGSPSGSPRATTRAFARRW